MKSMRNLARGCLNGGRNVVAAASCIAALCAAAPAPAADAPLLEVKRFIVEGENPLSERETEALLRPHLGAHENLNTLEAAAASLQSAIRERGYSFHRVIVPAQQPTAGELRLRILPFMLDQVTVTGNQRFSRENILRSVPGLKPGRAPNVGLLSQQVSLANEHPSKRLTLQVKEGVKPDSVDADLRVADVDPSQFFVGLTGGTRDVNNTLNQNTGYTRLTLGYQHSNLFDRDHTITLAYTTSPEYINGVTQVGAFYTLPFYGYNTMLTAYYTHSDVNSGTVGIGGQSFDVSGSGTFYGLKGTYLLPRMADVVHNVSLAWDVRHFKSNVTAAGTPLPSTTVGSRPITFRYAGRVERDPLVAAAYVEYSYNIGGGRSNNDTAYAFTRPATAGQPAADTEWDALRFGFDGTYALGTRWTFSTRFRGQYSNEPLIPGEQIGIAGSAAVRGFLEREITGDSGYYLNLEAQGPAIAYEISPLVFYDMGYRKHHTPVIGQSPHENIASAGAGLRWRWQRLDVNVTWAHVLNGATNATTRDHDKLHFSAFYRF